MDLFHVVVCQRLFLRWNSACHSFPDENAGNERFSYFFLLRGGCSDHRTLKAIRISKRPEPKVECNNSDHPRVIIISLLFCVILVFILNLKKKWKLLSSWINVEKMNKVSQLLYDIFLLVLHTTGKCKHSKTTIVNKNNFFCFFY